MGLTIATVIFAGKGEKQALLATMFRLANEARKRDKFALRLGGFAMKSVWPLLIGGYLPALLWGTTAIFQKQSAQAATGPAAYLIAFGGASAAVGMVWALAFRPAPWTGQGLGFATAAGVCFGVATGLINFALSTWAMPISKLAPIWSCNVLVTLAIGAIALREAAEVDLVKLLAGAVLIVGGAVLVGRA